MVGAFSMTDWIALVAFFVITFIAAGIGSMFTTKSLGVWYDALKKPSWTPSGGTIGAIWTILYILMAIAVWLVWDGAELSSIELPVILFFIQLSLNAAWSWLFFGRENPRMAFFEIIVLWLLIFLTLISFLQVELLAGLLLVPYLIWASIASALNYSVWKLNST